MACAATVKFVLGEDVKEFSDILREVKGLLEVGDRYGKCRECARPVASADMSQRSEHATGCSAGIAIPLPDLQRLAKAFLDYAVPEDSGNTYCPECERSAEHYEDADDIPHPDDCPVRVAERIVGLCECADTDTGEHPYRCNYCSRVMSLGGKDPRSATCVASEDVVGPVEQAALETGQGLTPDDPLNAIASVARAVDDMRDAATPRMPEVTYTDDEAESPL